MLHYPAWDRMNRDAGNLSYGPLAPSLEPNLRACNRSVISYEDKDDDKEWSSPEEGLLREIERLADHEFDVSHRQAPYSKALEKLFQRLKNDYVVSKRRKMWIESKDQTIKSLQMQLAQSQQKHQQLLKDILVATTSIPLIASSSTDLTEGIDTSIPTEPVPSVSAVAPSAWSDCSIPVEDAFRIKTILSEVNSNGGSVLASSERTPIETQLQTLSDTSLSPLQHQLFLALQNATTNKAMSTASNNRENLPQGGSWDSSTVLSEATTRLLQAETVLGLLKLVMAQNQVEIQGLEEEVARKQSELVHHRLLFDCAIELDRSGYEAQIGEDQVQIRALDNALEASREEARRHVDRIHELVRDIQDLNEVRDRQISNEQALQDRIQRLEDEVDELQFQLLEMERGLESGKKELEDQQAIILVQERQLAEFKAVSERWIASEEQQQEILDHLEKKQQKETSDLKARLTKIQKEKKRLEKEVSTLSVKIVRVQNRNEELEEQAKEDEEALKHMKASVVDKSHNSNDHNEAMVQEILELKAQVTSLDIQIEDLTTSLRLKDAELERTQDEIDNAGFHLEQELAAQRIIHETEMTELAEKKKIQAERERACQSKNVAHFQNMVTKLRTEVDEKDEKLRDLMTSWNQTRDQVQRQEASLRRRRRELEAVQSERDEVQRALTEVNDRLQNVSVAIELLEQAESKNATLVQTIQAKDQALREMEYRLRQLEEEGEELFDADEDEEDDAQGEVRDWRSTDALQRLD
ncbi:hypothetical protein BGZ83_002112 [Gryganskiella cystojenkinii]|nr:hypothetical protein BGZ83_002112 [Gryganskiella cystojenkinii]